MNTQERIAAAIESNMEQEPGLPNLFADEHGKLMKCITTGIAHALDGRVVATKHQLSEALLCRVHETYKFGIIGMTGFIKQGIHDAIVEAEADPHDHEVARESGALPIHCCMCKECRTVRDEMNAEGKGE